MDNIQVTLYGYMVGCGWLDARVQWAGYGDEVVTFVIPGNEGQEDIVLSTITLDSIADWVKAEAITRNIVSTVQIILDE